MEREGHRPDNLFPHGGSGGFSSGGPDGLSNSREYPFLDVAPRAAPGLLPRGQYGPTCRGGGDRRSQSPCGKPTDKALWETDLQSVLW